MQAGITKTVALEAEIEAPVQAGQELGRMTIASDGKVLSEIPIIAPETVEKLTWWELTARLLRRICMGEA